MGGPAVHDVLVEVGGGPRLPGRGRPSPVAIPTAGTGRPRPQDETGTATVGRTPVHHTPAGVAHTSRPTAMAVPHAAPLVAPSGAACPIDVAVPGVAVPYIQGAPPTEKLSRVGRPPDRGTVGVGPGRPTAKTVTRPPPHSVPLRTPVTLGKGPLHGRPRPKVVVAGATVFPYITLGDGGLGPDVGLICLRLTADRDTAADAVPRDTGRVTADGRPSGLPSRPCPCRTRRIS